MLLGYGLQRTKTNSFTAAYVKENAEKKKCRNPLLLAALVPTVNESKHSINKIIPILCAASRLRTAENQHH